MTDQWFDCWTTGCQPDTWAVVGCGQYEKTEKNKFSCPGGFSYECCTKNEQYEEPTTSAILGITHFREQLELDFKKTFSITKLTVGCITVCS